jgi:hypothetical protein
MADSICEPILEFDIHGQENLLRAQLHGQQIANPLDRRAGALYQSRFSRQKLPV